MEVLFLDETQELDKNNIWTIEFQSDDEETMVIDIGSEFDEDEILVVKIDNIQTHVRLSELNYTGPKKNWTKNEILDRLEGYIRIKNINDIKCSTYIRYFRVNPDGTTIFRPGGIMIVNAKDYIVLMSENIDGRKITWSVQKRVKITQGLNKGLTKNTIFFARKDAIEPIEVKLVERRSSKRRIKTSNKRSKKSTKNSVKKIERLINHKHKPRKKKK